MTQPSLSASNVFDAPDLKIHEESVPEWPNTDGTPGLMIFRQMNAEQSKKFAKDMDGPLGEDGMFLVLIRSTIDRDGNYVFAADDAPEEVIQDVIQKLRKKNMAVLNRLQRICLSLNGLGVAAKEEIKKD